MPWIPTRSHLKRKEEVYWRGAQAPNAAKFFAALLFSPTYSAAADNAAKDAVIETMTGNSMAEIVQQELSVTNYSRQQFSPAAGSYDTTQKRHEFSAPPFTFTTSSASFDYNIVALFGDTYATASKTFTADAATNRLTVTDHVMVNSDRVVPTTDTGGVLPAGVTAQEYFVKSIDANTVELYTTADLTTIVDFTSNGSGTLRLRYAQGSFELFHAYPNSSVAAGEGTQTFTIYLASARGGIDVNAQ